MLEVPLLSTDRVTETDRKREVIKASLVALLCGFINAVAISLLYGAFTDAYANHLNIGLCSAILSVNCFYALMASMFLFREDITFLQIAGTMINIAGVILISLASGEAHLSATPIMIIFSFLAATLMGTRIILSRYCTERINPIIYINLNFISDFIFGVVWILISVAGYWDTEFDLVSELVMFGAAIIACLADIFLFISIATGIAGPVVSIVTANGILVAVADMIINSSVPTLFQILGVLSCFIGVLTLSTGDLIREMFSDKLKRKRELHE